MHTFLLYARYLAVAGRSQLQYRASFLLLASSTLLATGVEFTGVWALFTRFGALKGWTLAEAAVLFGTVNMAFSLADAFGTAFDQFATLVKSGDFDRLLVRPRSTVMQVAGQEIALRRVGKLIAGLACVVWGIGALHAPLTVTRVAAWFLALSSAAALFAGLFILQGALAFFTTETLEVMNIATYGGCETAQYPFDVYRPWLRWLFTLVVPLALAIYRPLLIVLGRTTPSFLDWVSPVAGPLFLGFAVACWNAGVRRYQSTGS